MLTMSATGTILKTVYQYLNHLVEKGPRIQKVYFEFKNIHSEFVFYVIKKTKLFLLNLGLTFLDPNQILVNTQRCY